MNTLTEEQEKLTAKDFLAKRIETFPTNEEAVKLNGMTNEAIKRNVIAAMEEYAAYALTTPIGKQGEEGEWNTALLAQNEQYATQITSLQQQIQSLKDEEDKTPLLIDKLHSANLHIEMLQVFIKVKEQQLSDSNKRVEELEFAFKEGEHTKWELHKIIDSLQSEISALKQGKSGAWEEGYEEGWSDKGKYVNNPNAYNWEERHNQKLSQYLSALPAGKGGWIRVEALADLRNELYEDLGNGGMSVVGLSAYVKKLFSKLDAFIDGKFTLTRSTRTEG